MNRIVRTARCSLKTNLVLWLFAFHWSVVLFMSCAWEETHINKAEMVARFNGESRVTVISHKTVWDAEEQPICFYFCGGRGKDISNLVVEETHWVEPAEIFRDSVIKELKARFPLLDVHAIKVLDSSKKVENISLTDEAPYIVELKDSEWRLIHKDGTNWLYHFSRFDVRRENDQTLVSTAKCRRTLKWRTNLPRAWDEKDRLDLINRIRQVTEECAIDLISRVFG